MSESKQHLVVVIGIFAEDVGIHADLLSDHFIEHLVVFLSYSFVKLFILFHVNFWNFLLNKRYRHVA